MDTLNFSEWFKILGTMLGAFIGYTKWVLSQQEKMKLEWKQEKRELISMIRNKTDNTVHDLQITQVNRQLTTLEVKMDKLTEMVQELTVQMAGYIKDEDK
jgi:hypothetical protein|nr:MAG TPA: hypothetical protein [Ackermannviridae sp.]DAX66598.1 MAG TPA: hypothetical protein [Bacteriophage sp.]